MFTRNNKEKLYKFVYDKRHGTSWDKKSCTLLVVARNATYAVKKFYELAQNDVGNIIEFTEIKYPEGGVKSDGK